MNAKPLHNDDTTRTTDARHLRAELDALLAELGPGVVWRPCLDERGGVVACGRGHDEDGLPPGLAEDSGLLPGLDFSGRRVVDLGCNFGHFTFLAARCGAARAEGVDLDPRLVRACEVQRRLARMEAEQETGSMAFHARDILADPPVGRFDLVMLIDVLGKQFFASGLARGFLDAAEAHAHDGPAGEGPEPALLLSVRPWYKIDRHLKTTPEALDALYGPGFTRGRRFLALRWVVSRLRPGWRGRRLKPREGKSGPASKHLLLFTRRAGQHPHRRRP